MPKALAAAGGNTYRLREENVVAFVISRYLDTKRSVPEWEVRGKLGKLVPPNMVSPILEEMIASNALKVAAGDEKAPSRKFTPGVRK